MALFVVLAGVAAAVSPGDAAANLLAKLDTLSAETGLDDTARAKKFLALTRDSFDFEAMAMAALPAARRLPNSDRLRYASAYRTQMAIAFVKAVHRFGATSSTLLDLRERPNGSVVVLLKSKGKGRARRSAWLLCPGKAFRICDVEVDGVRVTRNQRADFRAVLASDGIEGLITALRSGRLAQF